MIIADTSIWIEFLKGNKTIYSKFKTLLEDQKILALEPIFGELLQGTKSLREQDIIMAYWLSIPKWNEAEIWIEAGKYSQKPNLLNNGVGLIDAVIICMARRSESFLWT